MADQFVYFIHATESGRIKIGFALDPFTRLAELQVGSPEVLELIGLIPGGRALESRIHVQLHSARLHGEWFECTDHVTVVIGDLLGWGKPTPQQVESARKAAALRAELGV